MGDKGSKKLGFWRKFILSTVIAASVLSPLGKDFSPRRISEPPNYSLTEKVIVAHRGGTEKYHENSAEAFNYARTTGAEVIELDVRKSAEGYVVNHDSRIADKSIRNLHYDDIRKLAPGYIIPRFEDALKIIQKQGKTAIIDLKDSGHARDVLEIAKKYLPAENIIISSKTIRDLKEIKNIDKNIKTTLVVGRSFNYNQIRALTGIIPWENIKNSQADYISVDGNNLNKSFYKNASKGDIGLFVYGLRDPTEIKEVLKRNCVYGVIVDNPTQAVKERNSLDAKLISETANLSHLENIVKIIFITSLIGLLFSHPNISGYVIKEEITKKSLAVIILTAVLFFALILLTIKILKKTIRIRSLKFA